MQSSAAPLRRSFSSLVAALRSPSLCPLPITLAARGPSSAPLHFRAPSFGGLLTTPAGSAGGALRAAASGVVPSPAPGLSLRGPNSREPRKSNHGARPCSSVRRRRKFKPRVNPHPFIPLSKMKRPKTCDF